MGLCLGSEVTEEEKNARINSTKIDRDLYEDAKREMNVVKILLLGETIMFFHAGPPAYSYGTGCYCQLFLSKWTPRGTSQSSRGFPS